MNNNIEKVNSISSSTSDIFDFWNSKNIVVHSKLRPIHKKAIEKALKEYSEEEIKNMISIYSIVLNNPEYRWDYKWNLDQFMSRGLRQFDGKTADDYLEDKETKVFIDIGNNEKVFSKNGKVIKREKIEVNG